MLIRVLPHLWRWTLRHSQWVLDKSRCNDSLRIPFRSKRLRISSFIAWLWCLDAIEQRCIYGSLQIPSWLWLWDSNCNQHIPRSIVLTLSLSHCVRISLNLCLIGCCLWYKPRTSWVIWQPTRDMEGMRRILRKAKVILPRRLPPLSLQPAIFCSRRKPILKLRIASWCAALHR